MHIGIAGPINLNSLNIKYDGDRTLWPKGLGGSPVNYEINALLERGYKVSIFSLCTEVNKGKSFEWHEENLSIYVGQYRKKARNRCIDLFKKERDFIKEAILKSQPDVIHAHWQYEWGWAALDSKIPTLLTCHDAPFNILKHQKDLYRVCRLIMAFFVLKKAKYLTAVSPYTAKGLRLFTKEKITIIPNFEPDTTFDHYKIKETVKQLHIAMVNNGFNELKNVSTGILAFNELKKTLKADLHLYGSGHGGNEEAYNWCKNNNIDITNIHFHGSLPIEVLMEKLSESDILLHTSKEESCPMVIIEAMAMGLPTLAGEKSGGVPWVLQDGGGKTVDINSIPDIVAGIKDIISIENYQKHSVDANRIALERFSKTVVLNAYLQELIKLNTSKNK